MASPIANTMLMPQKIFLTILFIFSSFALRAANETSISLTTQEQELYDLIMAYRQEKGLPDIPISPSLTYVAKTHVKDLQDFPPQDPKCNLHSWSTNGDWTSCCYANGHERAKCMWNKPRELTQYQGAGYEIAHMNSSGATAWGALNGWKNSLPHDSVILNIGRWNAYQWRAIGVGIYGNYAVVWFGEEPDPTEKSKPAQAAAATQEQTATTPSKNSQKEVDPEAEKLRLQLEQEKLQYKMEQQRLRTEARQERYRARQQRRAELNNGSTFIERYLDYSGYSYMGIASFGYTFSCADNRHLLTASVIDYRYTLLGVSPLAVEMAVTPFDTRVAYKPTVRIYIPALKYLSVVPYAGTAVDISGIGKISPKYDYDKERDFYVNVIAGVAVNCSFLKYVTVELKAEYRHPMVSPTRHLTGQGFYISTQIYLGLPKRKK